VDNAINPYIAGSPVRDPAMYFGRERLLETVQKCLVESQPSQIVVLHGQRRMGKTSTLYQLGHHLPGHYVPVLIDLQGMSLDGLGSLLWEMAQVIQRRLRRAANIRLPQEDREAWFAAPEQGIRRFFGAIGREVQDRHIVLMFDETMLLVDKIDAGMLDDRVYACLGDLIGTFSFLDMCFSIGSRAGLMKGEIASLPRPAVYCELTFLEPEAARALIKEPVRGTLDYAPEAVEHILTLTSGQPYYTQLVCHELFSRVQSEGRRTVTLSDIEAVRPGIVDMATAQLHYVWDRTPHLGQRVLLALAEIEEQGTRAHTPRQIGQFLLKHGIIASDAEIEGTLTSLDKRYIVDHRGHYAFHIDLFRHWILQHQRLEWI
jgi:hypothetical protein